jgi:hypothetical protein
LPGRANETGDNWSETDIFWLEIAPACAAVWAGGPDGRVVDSRVRARSRAVVLQALQQRQVPDVAMPPVPNFGTGGHGTFTIM